MSGVAHFSSGHEQAQCNRIRYFPLFGLFLASKGYNLSELIHYLDPTTLRMTESVYNFGLPEGNRAD